MDVDALIPPGLQFAPTVAFHIIFSNLAIGLAGYLAVLEGLWLATRNEVFKALYVFWLKIFAVSLCLSVVTSLAMSYPVIAWEMLAPLVLAASLLAIMLFGWKKAGPGLHAAATVLVALGALIWAFWVSSAYSWTPLSPSSASRLMHVTLAAYLTTALVVGAASAWRLLKRQDELESQMSLRMAVGILAIVAPMQLLVGDMSGKDVMLPQPAKLAAVETFWGTEQAFHLTALPRAAEAQDLRPLAPGDGGPTAISFWSFRVMAGLGVAMIVLGAWGAWLCARSAPERSGAFLRACVVMGPAGFVAAITGWTIAMLQATGGPQPVSANQVSAWMSGLLVICAAGALYILRLVAQGPAGPAPR
ncbi:MAG: cytochrome ubiquinol oxidase subunit I [Pseudomonadota bacterium]|uniref:cytochrome ubiquinol oxidase subunit I n=1 Tax=Phenylobacterium sp. TaxID=1871053 RepID=UPI0025EC0004|nr:cytochrome ubiquinol oxidase subunit I [Phenylobacterium sp.]MBT9472874.1 cytochrome ubiquinol oxidase subunit I [Phenylobacterium sp.]